MNEVCVAHLVREKNGLAPFERFLGTYRANPAGAEHDLLIIFKGFSQSHVPDGYETALAGMPHKRYFVEDVGLDIGPYLEVARHLQYRYFCFFNSFSQILAPDWLRNMRHWITRPGVGIVGATASYQSVSSDFHDYRLIEKQETFKDRLRIIKRFILYLAKIHGRFPPFPNYHIRTNAFMAARETFSRLNQGKIRFKWDAYGFESGRNSLTWQIMRMGLSPIVVDKDGNGYEKEHWFESETFWLKEQKNLLVADNQTAAYAEGDSTLRTRLSFHAWRRWPDGTPRQDFPKDAETK